MHVSIHGNLDRGMSQHLAESLDLHTGLHAACGKGMTERMKMQIPDAAAFYDLFKMSVIFLGSTGDKVPDNR